MLYMVVKVFCKEREVYPNSSRQCMNHEEGIVAAPTKMGKGRGVMRQSRKPISNCSN